MMVVRKTVLEYIIALVVVKNKVRLKKGFINVIKNAKVWVERSPILKDRFSLIIWKYVGKWCEAKCLMCIDFSYM
jgi:hypothetical protein